MGPHPELAALSAIDLARLLARGDMTSAELVEMSLHRIAALDEGNTRAVIEVNPDAIDIARRSDRERRRGRMCTADARAMPRRPSRSDWRRS